MVGSNADTASKEEILTIVGSKAAIDIASKVGGRIGTKIIGKTIAKSGSILAGKKLGSKVGAKVGAKFAGKFVGKGVIGTIPFLGAAFGGGINLWFVNSLSKSADRVL